MYASGIPRLYDVQILQPANPHLSTLAIGHYSPSCTSYLLWQLKGSMVLNNSTYCTLMLIYANSLDSHRASEQKGPVSALSLPLALSMGPLGRQEVPSRAENAVVPLPCQHIRPNSECSHAPQREGPTLRPSSMHAKWLPQ